VEDILKRLGRRIRELRIRQGFASQEAFADYCRLHRTFIGHLETGRKDFRLTTIIRVADALGVSLSELFAGMEEGRSPAGAIRGRLPFDRSRVLQELNVLEQSVRKLKRLAGGEPSSGDKGPEMGQADRGESKAKRRR
jgi:transcriptional regulator with XRE-family HTH domain